MTQKEKRVIYLALCISRVVFLFGDYILSNNQKYIPSSNFNQNQESAKSKQDLTISQEIQNFKQSSYDQYKSIQKNTNQTTLNTSTNSLSIEQTWTSISQKLQDVGISKQDIDNIQLKDLQKEDPSKNFDDISILQNIYSKTQNTSVLNILLEKLVHNYQFKEAKIYITNFNNWNYSKDIDANLYLHILINSISASDPRDLTYFELVLNEIYQQWFLSKDDMSFYLGLLKIRNKDRAWANKIFDTIVSPRYSQFISSYQDTLNNSYFKSDIPSYYKDGLIALAMLKNWYFSISKKIALSISLQNESYILPYQLLAYSHFLTNDRDAAIDYFFKLIDINPAKEENYKFMIWIAYYRNQKYEQSVLYISQVKTKIYQTDVYRYLILNYIAWNDTDRLIRIRQSILWQDNLQKSDFYTFFYNFFFLPFKNQEIFAKYNQNPQLATSFLTKCYEVFDSTDDDICIYGQAWQDIANKNWDAALDKLLYLSDHYPQSYIFHALWDYYLSQNDTQQSKQYYLKAVSMTDSEIEKSIIRQKMMQ